MVKPSSSAAALPLLKEIRAALDARVDEKVKAAQPASIKSPVKTLGVRSTVVRAVAKDVFTKNRAAIDYETAVAIADAAMPRKVREEILVAIDLLERFQREFEPGLVARLDKWCSLVADDLELSEAIGTRIGAPAFALDPAKITIVRKWAKLKSTGRRQLALLCASGLVTEGRREAFAVLDLCELLLHEDHPVLVAGVASLLKQTTRVDAKAVQDFLFRRSIDGNPEILRAGSENLDAARRAALIAKLEAQAALYAATPTAVRA